MFLGARHSASVDVDNSARWLRRRHLFLHRSGLIEAEIVGAMTVPQKVTLEGTQSILGIRFHPGMAGLCLPIDSPRLTDLTVPLRQLFGTDVNDFFGDLVTGNSVEQRISLIEQRVSRLPRVTSVHAAISDPVGRRGLVSIKDLAAVAGVSPRQLRRTCLSNSGLTPKRLSRILRFRHAAGLIQRTQTSWAAIAAQCGYFDQSHMIRDFHELAGTSPDNFVLRRA